jgi:hypothetical protein
MTRAPSQAANATGNTPGLDHLADRVRGKPGENWNNGASCIHLTSEANEVAAAPATAGSNVISICPAPDIFGHSSSAVADRRADLLPVRILLFGFFG